MKEITINELYEKLVDFYKDKFPHNPSGVLRWHIDKKMKEGKTIEQAIKELIKESE